MRSSRLLWLCGAVRPGCTSGTCFWNWVRVRTDPSGPWGQEAGATCRLSVHPCIPDRSARCWPPPVGGEWGGGLASILPAVAEGSGVWPAELRPPCAPHSGQGAGSRRRWLLNGWFCSCQGPHSGPALDLHPEASPLHECVRLVVVVSCGVGNGPGQAASRSPLCLALPSGAAPVFSLSAASPSGGRGDVQASTWPASRGWIRPECSAPSCVAFLGRGGVPCVLGWVWAAPRLPGDAWMIIISHSAGGAWPRTRPLQRTASGSGGDRGLFDSPGG